MTKRDREVRIDRKSNALYELTDRSITCHLCGRTSGHPGDVENTYCAYCKVPLRTWYTTYVLRAERFIEDMRTIGIQASVEVEVETVNGFETLTLET